MLVLVTGGGGFLGQAIVRALVARGEKVRVLGRSEYPALASLPVECVRGDVRDPEAVERAVNGVEGIFHVAAKVGYWGPKDEYFTTNVLGTENLLRAAARHRVSRLVYTSSPSVVIGTRGGFENADENTPYPSRHLYDYAASKAAAEARVLAADTPGGLRTAAIRPHFIFGPGDPQIVPRLVQAAKQGKLVRIGDGTNRVDVTYVDNAVTAHLLAFDALGAPDTRVGGQAYFIGQEQPVVLWDFVTRILAAFQAPPVTRRVPLGVARVLGGGIEAAYRLLGIEREPPLTRSVALMMGTSHWFSHAKAQRDFGYAPEISLEEGLARVFAEAGPA